MTASLEILVVAEYVFVQPPAAAADAGDDDRAVGGSPSG